ncbi:alpha-galactosidase [Roseivivax sp. GX 12232]|uniref:alpha-galactosidase n=1 Tax=Roseivivax sp. GX 12232 TaxID=2900547 RepID=UPI001E53ED51|nr:alpha-galactosidase [Roseivivax sp. GX 12232]MCE0506124.1 alpha-galactosidase [Roseivivax sp. GX 12232]
MTGPWRIDDATQTLVLAATGTELPGVIYWGDPLPPEEDLAELARATRSDIGGGMLDALPELTICPTHGAGFPGQPGLSLADADGAPLLPRLSLEAVDCDGTRARVRGRDAALGLSYEARIETTSSNVLKLSARLTSEAPVRLQWLSAPVLAAPQSSAEVLTVSGRWLSEFQLDRQPWRQGAILQEALNGRSGHEHFPGAYLLEAGAAKTRGAVQALHYGWSGGHRFLAEELSDGRRQVQFGHAAGSERAPGTSFETATLYAAHGNAGLNSAAVRLQAYLRDDHVAWRDPARPRPVHYNCWEAVYFDHDLEVLSDIAERAARIGAERFVLDDGWFGARDDDTTSLGDWQVDARKWPEGLGPLIDRVEALGMRFGLWVEPEMVNPQSALFRAHPDWILGPADQTLGRAQYVLDMSRAEVRDHLFEALDAVFSAHRIDYVKWDHNRVLPVADAAQARGVYALFDRLRAAHPGIEFETCASGGGRIDYGILSRTERVWLSDSNDALERLRIQHDAALFLPAAVTGAHVGARDSHSSGRSLPMGFRAGVAASRHMGFEMDLRDLTEAEEAVLTRLTAWWKAARGWLFGAALHRLDSDDPAMTGELQVAADGSRFALFAGQSQTSRQSLPRPLRLTGLDPAARYELRLANPEDAPPQSRGPNRLKTGPIRASGRWLMAQGLTLPLAWPATMWIVEGRRLD